MTPQETETMYFKMIEKVADDILALSLRDREVAMKELQTLCQSTRLHIEEIVSRNHRLRYNADVEAVADAISKTGMRISPDILIETYGNAFASAFLHWNSDRVKAQFVDGVVEKLRWRSLTVEQKQREDDDDFPCM